MQAVDTLLVPLQTKPAIKMAPVGFHYDARKPYELFQAEDVGTFFIRKRLGNGLYSWYELVEAIVSVPEHMSDEYEVDFVVK